MQDEEKQFFHNFDQIDEIIREILLKWLENMTWKFQALWSENGKLYFNT